jgi:hypothetical protein
LTKKEKMWVRGKESWFSSPCCNLIAISRCYHQMCMWEREEEREREWVTECCYTVLGSLLYSSPKVYEIEI